MFILQCLFWSIWPNHGCFSANLHFGQNYLSCNDQGGGERPCSWWRSPFVPWIFFFLSFSDSGCAKWPKKSSSILSSMFRFVRPLIRSPMSLSSKQQTRWSFQILKQNLFSWDCQTCLLEQIGNPFIFSGQSGSWSSTDLRMFKILTTKEKQGQNVHLHIE